MIGDEWLKELFAWESESMQGKVGVSLFSC